MAANSRVQADHSAEKKDRKWQGHLITGGGLLLFSGICMVLFRYFPECFFPWYRNFSKWIIGILARISSVVPFALWDYIEVVLIILILFSLVQMIRKRRSLLSWFSGIFLTAAIIASELVICWMLNHYAPSLSDELDLSVREYSEDELYAATEYYFDLASEDALRIPRDPETGEALRQDFYELAKIAGKSYETLSEKWSIFRGSTLPVKKLSLFGDYLLYKGFTGEFMPVTGEASVPENESPVGIGFTMCHEAAHRLGIASEEEANFAAFLAGTGSDDVRLRYAGNYEAFIYCYNKLYNRNYDRLVELLQEKETEESYARVLKDGDDAREYYRKYESPVQETAEKINDTYLKTFSEDDGVQSYGEVVDELIAWYLLQRTDETSQ